MNPESKSFEEIMYNVHNLTDANYVETIEDMINFSNEEQRKELYNEFVKEIKNRIIMHTSYNDDELLEADVNQIMNELIELDPSIEQVFIDNEFNLENIKANIKNLSSAQEIPEEEKEITKINARINELETQYLELYKKDILLFDLSDKKEEIEQKIDNIKVLSEEEEKLKAINEEYVKILEEDLSTIKNDIKNVEDNYSELSTEDLMMLMNRNELYPNEIEKAARDAIRNGDIVSYEASKIEEEEKKVESHFDDVLKKLDEINYGRFGQETPAKTNPFENSSDEDLREELLALNEQKEKILSENSRQQLKDSIDDIVSVTSHDSSVTLSDVEEVSEISYRIEIINTELKRRELENSKNKIIDNYKKELMELRKLKFTRNAYHEIIEDAKTDLNSVVESENQDKIVNEFLNNHRRIKKINGYENAEKLRKELTSEIKANQKIKPKSIAKAEKNQKLWLKALAGTAGFVSGLAMSCVPGVGTIRMGISVTKLAGSAVNFWTIKHPNGKIAKVKNNINDKINSKFPNIMNKVEKMRAALKQTPLNCFVNGVALGYTVGNIIELVTGETVFEHAKNFFDSEPSDIVIDSPEIELPSEEPTVTPEPTPGIENPEVLDKTPIVNEPNINNPVTPEPLPGINDAPTIGDNIVETFIPKEGEVFDLSSIAEGLVSSDATNSVDLMQSLGKEVTFDKAVQLSDGRIMWHFKQLNGAGYAWFDSADIQELLSKTTDGISKSI